MSITEKIASVFPDRSPRVLLTSADMNCFITKEFEHKIPDQKNLGDLVTELGYLQLKAIGYVDALHQAGCPVRKPDSLIEKLKM